MPPLPGSKFSINQRVKASELHHRWRGQLTRQVSSQWLPILPPNQTYCRHHTCDAANLCLGSRAPDIAGRSVKADTRGVDIGITTVGPVDEARHRVQQGSAERGKAIFDARRLGRKDLAGDQSVALEVAQRLGEHALGDVA